MKILNITQATIQKRVQKEMVIIMKMVWYTVIKNNMVERLDGITNMTKKKKIKSYKI